MQCFGKCLGGTAQGAKLCVYVYNYVSVCQKSLPCSS